MQRVWNRVIGAGIFTTAFLCILILSLFFVQLLPVRKTVNDSIRFSFVATNILDFLEMYGGSLPIFLEQSTEQLSLFITVTPKSSKKILLDAIVKEQDLKVDEYAERNMLTLINAERRKYGSIPLSENTLLRTIAREYSKKMFLERFFSHYDMDGKDIGNRLNFAGITFLFAGENLAYAPTMFIAHEGLMKSEGHKANILNHHFRSAGIGVIDAGVWGKMFTQVFIN